MNNFPQQNQQKPIPNTTPQFFQQGNQPAPQFQFTNKNQQAGIGNPQFQAQPQIHTMQQGQMNPPQQFNQQNNQNIPQGKSQGGQAQQFGLFNNNSQITNNNVNPQIQLNNQNNNFNNAKPQVNQVNNQFQKFGAGPFPISNQNPTFPNQQQTANKFQIQPQKSSECEAKPQQQFPQMMKPQQQQMQPNFLQQKYPRVDVKNEEDKKQLVKNLNQYFQDGNSEFVMECIKQIIENDIRIKLPEQSINIK